MISVDGNTQFSFPSQDEIRNLVRPNGTQANITLTPSFLAEIAAGKNLL